jgi:hypothetical protein
MKTIRVLLTFLMAVAIVELVPAQTRAQSFKLTISPVQDVVHSGGKVSVKVALKNTSEDEIFLGGGPCGQVESITTFEDFLPVVKDAKGMEPPLTRLGRELLRRPNPGETFPAVVIGCMGAPYPLSPGSIHAAEVIVSDLYDLVEPGSYTVQIRFDPSKQGMGVPLEHSDHKKESKHEIMRNLWL